MSIRLPAALQPALCAGLLFAAALGTSVQAQDFKVTPTIVESHGREGAATVQALNVEVTLSLALQAMGAVTDFTVTYVDPAGATVGKPVKVKLNTPPTPGDQNKLKLEVPKSAQPIGSKMIISPDILPEATVTLKITQGTGKIQKATAMVVPGPPVDPGGPPKRWEFELPGPNPQDPMRLDYGGRAGAVVSGGFDLQLTPSTGSTYDAFVVGRTSHLTLDDDSYLFYADTEWLGTIDVAAGATAGAFNFFGIGLAGLWSYDALTGSTRLVTTAASPFGAAVLQTVAEPAPLVLVPLALALLAWCGRHRPAAAAGRLLQSL